MVVALAAASQALVDIPSFPAVHRQMTLAEALSQDLIKGNPEICIGGLDMPCKFPAVYVV
jgi:hypothetical protein